jgi:hypothetical protein
MASLAQIRTALKTTIETAIPTLKVYPTVESVNVVPAAVVLPGEADFLVAMKRGTDTYTFQLLVMVAAGDAEVAQNSLDTFVTGAGDTSIRQAVFNARTLGLSDTDAHVSGWSGYAARFESAGIDHIGAVLALTVHTSGTS